MPHFWSSNKASAQKRQKPMSRASPNAWHQSSSFIYPVSLSLVQQWSVAPGTKDESLGICLKKLLKYYPKNCHALKPLNKCLAFKQLMNEKDDKKTVKIRRLALSVLAKYKKAFLRRLCLDISNRDFPIEKLIGATERLVMFQGPTPIFKPSLRLKKFFVNTKTLKSIHVHEQKEASTCLIGWIQYIPLLRSLTVSNLPYMPYFLNKRIFLASRAYLKSLNILGALDDVYDKSSTALIELLNMIVDIKTLSNLKIHVNTSKDASLDRTLLDKFHPRNIIADVKWVKNSLQAIFSKNRGSVKATLVN
uniref:Predicted protein n=1 Tax=Hordeum vulgare subsp. vulgare TaxID=112509 RepID=F2DGF9_HORVV|nr:predicted protein [Hordeum vulgare subsp. vulgare]